MATEDPDSPYWKDARLHFSDQHPIQVVENSSRQNREVAAKGDDHAGAELNPAQAL